MPKLLRTAVIRMAGNLEQGTVTRDNGDGTTDITIYSRDGAAFGGGTDPHPDA